MGVWVSKCINDMTKTVRSHSAERCHDAWCGLSRSLLTLSSTALLMGATIHKPVHDFI